MNRFNRWVAPWLPARLIEAVARSCYIQALHQGSLMTTTTIRIDDELKARVAAAAERAGKTSHAFILDAIAQTVEQSEVDVAFHQVADKRWERILATGQTMPWDDAKAWLEARSRGEHPPKPAARKLGR
jgi:predicted transcriptional regulator